MIPQALLGATGIAVSRIGLGTVKLGRNQKIHYPEHFDLPTDDAILNLLDCAKSLGINLLDTAPAYGCSEERLGKALQGQRQQWIVCTKAGEEFSDNESQYNFSKSAIRQSIERSLRRLKTDYLDMVLIHSNGDDIKIIKEDAVFETLQQLKQAGMIRAFGMSTKTVEGGMLAVDHSDVVMVTYNPIHVVEQPVIAYAKKKNKGVLIKKAFASGHLQKITGEDPVQTAMQFIFREPGISSVVLGTLSEKHLQHNVSCAENAIHA